MNLGGIEKMSDTNRIDNIFEEKIERLSVRDLTPEQTNALGELGETAKER